MANNKTYTITKASIKKFKEKEAKMTPKQRRAASKAQVEANTAANRISKNKKA